MFPISLTAWDFQCSFIIIKNTFYIYLSIHPSIYPFILQFKAEKFFCEWETGTYLLLCSSSKADYQFNRLLHRYKKRFAFLSLFFDMSMTRRSFPWKLKRLSWLCDRTTVGVLLLLIILIYCKVFHYLLWGTDKFHKKTHSRCKNRKEGRTGWKETLWCR